VIDNLQISAFSPVSADVVFNVIDITGRSYCSYHDKLQTGFNEIQIPASSLPSGFYLLIIQAEGSSPTMAGKFVK
jgi:hypothetical protein